MKDSLCTQSIVAPTPDKECVGGVDYAHMLPMAQSASLQCSVGGLVRTRALLAVAKQACYMHERVCELNELRRSLGHTDCLDGQHVSTAPTDNNTLPLADTNAANTCMTLQQTCTLLTGCLALQVQKFGQLLSANSGAAAQQPTTGQTEAMLLYWLVSSPRYCCARLLHCVASMHKTGVYDDSLHLAAARNRCLACHRNEVQALKLACGHRFCSTCLEAVSATSKQQSTCPVCQVTAAVVPSVASVAALPARRSKSAAAALTTTATASTAAATPSSESAAACAATTAAAAAAVAMAAVVPALTCQVTAATAAIDLSATVAAERKQCASAAVECITTTTTSTTTTTATSSVTTTTTTTVTRRGYQSGPVIRNIDSLESIVHHAAPGAIIVLDIDETIIMGAHETMLFTRSGMQALRSHVCALDVEHSAKVEHMQRFQRVLEEKVLVEDRTAEIIRGLQNKGAWVLGLTTRYAETAHKTHCILRHLGVDLNINSPLGTEALQDPETDALYAHGIIFTNATNKGVVLEQFLTNAVFRCEDELLTRADGVNPEDVEAARARLPTSIAFVDDRHDNVMAVSTLVDFVRRHDIELACYRFHGAARESALGGVSDDLLDGVLQHQVEAFVARQHVMSDTEAWLAFIEQHTHHSSETD